MIAGDTLSSAAPARRHRGWRALIGHVRAGGGGTSPFDVLVSTDVAPFGERLLANKAFMQVSPKNATNSTWSCGGALTLQLWLSPYETVWSGSVSPCGTWLLYGGAICMLVNLATGSSTLLLGLGLVEPKLESRAGQKARQLPVCGCCAFSMDSTRAIASKGTSLAVFEVGMRACVAILEAGEAALVACALSATHAAAVDAAGHAYIWALPLPHELQAHGQHEAVRTGGDGGEPPAGVRRLHVRASKLTLIGAKSCAPLSTDTSGGVFAFVGAFGLQVWKRIVVNAARAQGSHTESPISLHATARVCTLLTVRRLRALCVCGAGECLRRARADATRRRPRPRPCGHGHSTADHDAARDGGTGGQARGGRAGDHLDGEPGGARAHTHTHAARACHAVRVLCPLSHCGCAVVVAAQVRLWDEHGSCVGSVEVEVDDGALNGAWLGSGGRLCLVLSGASTLALYDVASDGTPLTPPRKPLLGGRHALSSYAPTEPRTGHTQGPHSTLHL